MQATRKSWKQEKSDQTYRSQMLFVLGISGVVAFAIWLFIIFRRDTLATYTASISVQNYRQTLPSIPPWSPSDLIEAAKSKALRPFQEIRTANVKLENSVNVENFIGELKPDNPSVEYPLVIQLRCHAATRNTPDGLRCELLINESEKEPYYLDQMLEKLSEFPTNNIIILGDVCDISFLPMERIIVNPLASAFRASCKRLSSKVKNKNQNIWLICATADGQISYRNRAEKTLFQAACEEAFGTANKVLTLDDFYSTLLRYTHVASKGTQTPLMFRVGDDQAPILPGHPIAKNVRLSIHEKAVVSKNAPDESGKKDSQEENPNGSKDKKGMDGPNSTSKPPSDTTPVPPNSIWQLRDQWSNVPTEKNTWTWTAAEYASAKWRSALQKEASRSLPAKASNNNDEWKDFVLWDTAIQSISNGQPNGLASGQPIDSFLTFKTRLFWTNKELLPENLQNNWRSILDSYRDYITTVSELLFWRDLFMLAPRKNNTDSSNLDEETLRSMITYALEMRKKIPARDDQSAIEKWNESKSATPDASPRSKLKNKLAQMVTQLENAKPWTWIDEHACLTLLASPLPNGDQRKRLETVLAKNTVPIEKLTWDEKLEPLINASQNPELLLTKSRLVSEFAKASAELYQIPLSTEVTKSIANLEDILAFSEGYRRHQDELIERLGRRGDPIEEKELGQKINRWHVYNLAELRSSLFDIATKDPQGNFGIVTFPSNARAIEVRIEGKPFIDLSENTATPAFQLGVGYVGQLDDPLPSCDLIWNSNPSIPDLKLFVGTKEWPKNTKTSVKVTDRALKVQLGLPNEDFRFPPNTWINIQTPDSSRGISIPVFQQAQAIALVAFEKTPNRRIQLPQRESSSVEIKGPVIKGAETTIEFAMQNKQPRVRNATLKIYSNDSPSKLIAESKLVELPAASYTNQEMPTISVSLQPIVSNEKSPAMALPSLDRKLLYEIEEFEAPEIASDDKSAVPKIGKRIAIYSGYLELMASDPRELVSVKFDPDVQQGFTPRLSFMLEEHPYLPKEFELKMVPMTGTTISKQYPIQTERRTVEAELPKLERDTDILMSFGMGGYPRTHFFSLNANATPPLSELPPPSHIDLSKLEFYPIFSEPKTDPAAQPVELVRSKSDANELTRLVFPTWIEQEGRAIVKYSGLRVRGVFDTPPGEDIQWSIRRSDSPNTAPFLSGSWHDRNFIPRMKFDNSMTLRFDVTEVDRVIDLSTISHDTSEEFVLTLQAGTKKSTWTLLFDRMDPNPKGRWNNNAQTKEFIDLYKDSEMDIEFLSQDNSGGSGLIFGRVSRSGQKDDRYKASQELNWEPSVFQRDGKTGIRFSVDTKSFEKSPAGEYWIHIATEDRAGNQQLNHPPLKIIWHKSPAQPQEKSP